MQQESLYLIGFMGAGKTSVGNLLGDMCGLAVIDTDQVIEKQENMPIRDLFERHGEAYFRELETDVLQKLANGGAGAPAIITTGGGIILKEKNRQLLKESGRTIFLQCNPKVVVERLQQDTTRPLIKNKTIEEINHMYQMRLPLYLECAITSIDTSAQSIKEVAESIKLRMNI
ncbi:shikimate kinase [Lederbergia citrea]|uniref:shikimate kinase n=1 Tax=Lederbergia citrea TaxID=2833581 RepID=UPI002015F315|nr:shikimate kinase [Lederbergia citrea]